MNKIHINSTNIVIYFNKCVYSNQHTTFYTNWNKIQKIRIIAKFEINKFNL